MAVCVPPSPPAVVFEDTISTEGRRTSARTVDYARPVIYDGVAVAVATNVRRVQIADGVVVSVQPSNVIPMRAADPSLKKKLRTERVSRLEREYRW